MFKKAAARKMKYKQHMKKIMAQQEDDDGSISSDNIDELEMNILGSILNDGRPFLQLTPWMSIFPGIVIFLSVLVINLIGDTLRDRLDISQGIR